MIDHEKLFKDPDFAPESSHSPLFFEGDLDKQTAIEIDLQVKKLDWLRPKLIGPKPTLTGFADLNLQGAAPEELAEMKTQYKVHGHRIIQGKLENRWFLNALTMIAAEQKLFD